MELKSFSWEVRSETCAVKTVDLSLLKEGTTGIPKNVVPFFFGSQLEEGDERLLEFNVLGVKAECKILRKNNRHRLFFMELKKALAAYHLAIGDLLFFDKNPFKRDSFIVSALLDSSKEIIQPDFAIVNFIGESRPVYSTCRLGHELFSERVRRRFDYSCCATGVKELTPKILIASHIKPWRLASPNEKVDPFNGFLLSPHIDKLFDLGHISFSDKGDAIVASSCVENTKALWKIENCRISNIAKDSLKYLAFHREFHNLN